MQHRLAVALATLAGAATADEAESLMALVHGNGPAVALLRKAAGDWVAEQYHGPGHLNALQADRLARPTPARAQTFSTVDGDRSSPVS